MYETIKLAMSDAENKAWEALSGYKFLMFGYHAAQWVLLYHLSNEHRPNPFKDLVLMAQRRQNNE